MKWRDWLVDYSRGDNLVLFWRLFEWRSHTATNGCAISSRCCSAGLRTVTADISGVETKFDGRPRLPHGLHGVFISRFARVGRDCCLYQNVTIGEIDRRAPKIGDRCFIGAGAVLVGGITVGNDVKIGAGAIVHDDVPDGVTLVCDASRIVKRG